MPTSLEIRKALATNRGESLADFARRHDFEPRTVQQVVRRYAGTRAPRSPWGVTTNQILDALAADTGLAFDLAKAA